VKNLLLILALAILWWIGGMFAGAGLSAYFDLDWTIQCAALNVIVGMLMLLLVTHNETARRIFYEGPRGDDRGNHSLLFCGYFRYLYYLPV
jgi:hypothetical protein